MPVMIVFLIVMAYTVIQISKLAKTKHVFPRAQNLLTVAVLQGAIGYTQYFTDVPPLLVGFHVGGAVAVWIMTLRLNLAFRLQIENDEEYLVSK